MSTLNNYVDWHRRQVLKEEERQSQLLHLLRVKAREIMLALVKNYNVEKVYLFGSVAVGNITELSDIDIAVMGLDEEKYLAAYGVLEELAAPFAVDLVLLETATDTLRARIEREGVVLYDLEGEKDSQAAAPGFRDKR